MAKNENEELERPHPKNTLNDMGGDRFLYFTKSVLTTAYPAVYSHELRKQHGANKPPQLMAQLIEFFTKTGMSVLDPFAGVGGTLIGASIATPGRRKCVGIEISQQWTDIYTQVLQENPDLLPQTMIQGDCIEIMDHLADAHMALGERAEALAVWKKALTLETRSKRERDRKVQVEKKLKAIGGEL